MIISNIDMWDFGNPNVINLWIASISLFVSVIVLFVTVRTWRLKKGQSVRTSLEISITDKPYVSNIIVENLKDRDLVIFGIYLKFGANVYIDLLDIDSHYDRYHHIIPALSTRVFELGPALYYTEHSFEVDTENLLRNWDSASIILRTNMGKIKAKKFKKGWSPISQYFRNYGTHYIKTHRFYTKESVPSSRIQTENFIDYSSYDKRVKFVVTLKFADGKVYDLDIPSTNTYIPFQKLNFSSEVLASCESLKHYLIDSRSNHLVEFVDIIQIIDIGSIFEKNRKGLSPTPYGYRIEKLNKFQYYFIWRFKTCLHKLMYPPYPSKLFSLYCRLGIKKLPNNGPNTTTSTKCQVSSSSKTKKKKRR